MTALAVRLGAWTIVFLLTYLLKVEEGKGRQERRGRGWETGGNIQEKREGRGQKTHVWSFIFKIPDAPLWQSKSAFDSVIMSYDIDTRHKQLAVHVTF